MALDGVVANTGLDPDGCGHTVILAYGDDWQALDTDMQLPAGMGPRLRRYDGMRRSDSIGGLGSCRAPMGAHVRFEVWRVGGRVDLRRVLRS
ncbi:MAG: hypothetical protein OXP73_08360 [Chloroflexota bacterium]|nr:hypothetical protein [Chloroflexota bacterium]